MLDFPPFLPKLLVTEFCLLCCLCLQREFRFVHSVTACLLTITIVVCLIWFPSQQLSRPMVLWRTIAYVRADDDGNFDPHPLARRRFIFYGRSVFQLTGVLSILLREWFFGIKLCVRAGSQGRLTPLVVDLPANEETMDIVVLTAGSPGENSAVSFSSHSALVICSSSQVLMKSVRLIMVTRIE